MDVEQETPMKLLIAIMAAAGLSGCVAYGGGTYGAADVYYGSPYPAYGSGGYYSSGVVVVPQPHYYGRNPDRGYRDRGHRDSGWRDRGHRDRDRDGVPNRFDRDRDGDGVPNRRDARPNNPRVH
jgi:hypothetical protein